MEIYPHSAKTFLREAQESLERLRKSKDSDDIRRALITFLNSTKHVIQQLQTDFKSKISDFDDWYKPHKEFLMEDKISRFFWILRNEITKGGNDGIKFKSLKLSIPSDIGNFEIKGPVVLGASVGVSVKIQKGEIYEWRQEKNLLDLETSWEFLDFPDENSIDLCEQYVATLENVVDSFIKRFSVIVI